MNWQPIETLNPVDNMVVYLWDKENEAPVVAIYDLGSWWVNNSYGCNEDGEIPICYISHWAPIEPPK
jgi:hypothetical protein